LSQFSRQSKNKTKNIFSKQAKNIFVICSYLVWQ